MNESVHRYVCDLYLKEDQCNDAVWSTCNPVWIILAPMSQFDCDI